MSERRATSGSCPPSSNHSLKGAQKNEKPVAVGGPDGSCGRTQRMRAQNHCGESAGGRAGASTRTLDDRAGTRPGRSARPGRSTWTGRSTRWRHIWRARAPCVRRHCDIAVLAGNHTFHGSAGWQPRIGCALIRQGRAVDRRERLGGRGSSVAEAKPGKSAQVRSAFDRRGRQANLSQGSVIKFLGDETARRFDFDSVFHQRIGIRGYGNAAGGG
jgi:hypothetical protein